MGEVKGPLVSFRTIQYQSITISIFQYILPRPPLPLPSTPPPSYFSPPPPPHTAPAPIYLTLPPCPSFFLLVPSSCRSSSPYATSLSISLSSRPLILVQLFMPLSLRTCLFIYILFFSFPSPIVAALSLTLPLLHRPLSPLLPRVFHYPYNPH